jgi:uncharacterized membrane protein
MNEMDMTDMIYYVIAVALITFGLWGTIDAIKQVKNNK